MQIIFCFVDYDFLQFSSHIFYNVVDCKIQLLDRLRYQINNF